MVREIGNLQLAEGAVSEAFVEASGRWPTEGPTTEQISHACTVAVGHNCGGT